jgi:hypothetical protein
MEKTHSRGDLFPAIAAQKWTRAQIEFGGKQRASFIHVSRARFFAPLSRCDRRRENLYGIRCCPPGDDNTIKRNLKTAKSLVGAARDLEMPRLFSARLN